MVLKKPAPGTVVDSEAREIAFQVHYGRTGWFYTLARDPLSVSSKIFFDKDSENAPML